MLSNPAFGYMTVVYLYIYIYIYIYIFLKITMRECLGPYALYWILIKCLHCRKLWLFPENLQWKTEIQQQLRYKTKPRMRTLFRALRLFCFVLFFFPSFNFFFSHSLLGILSPQERKSSLLQEHWKIYRRNGLFCFYSLFIFFPLAKTNTFAFWSQQHQSIVLAID